MLIAEVLCPFRSRVRALSGYANLLFSRGGGGGTVSLIKSKVIPAQDLIGSRVFDQILWLFFSNVLDVSFMSLLPSLPCRAPTRCGKTSVPRPPSCTPSSGEKRFTLGKSKCLWAAVTCADVPPERPSWQQWPFSMPSRRWQTWLPAPEVSPRVLLPPSQAAHHHLVLFQKAKETLRWLWS